MTLAAGTRLGSYVLDSLVGVGGMGEVYRSRDVALHRDVAVKILPQVLALDADRLARFSREAQTLAALSHPNIAHIYGLVEAPLDAGAHVHALVMEWIDGEDLAHRIARGPLPVDDALSIASQLASALEAAHEQGIIHRDIKPANIKVKADGTVKVLDFGLAKAADPARTASGSDLVASPTMTSPALTALGIILGTAAYMAPEQARGRAVDRRADIWAFGVVLVEMLTGRQLFQGETVSDVMVSVLTAPIDLTTLPADVPRRVREVIARCLERDPKRRLRDIGEARVALEPHPEDSVASGIRSALSSGPAVVAAPRSRPWFAWAVAISALAVATTFAALWAGTRITKPGAERLQLEIGPPWGEQLIVGSNAGSVVVSPDGSMVAFLAQAPAGRRLYVRSLRSGEARAISGTTEAHYPFWSPDSRSLAYFANGKLMKVSIAGGLPEAIATIQQGRGGTWTDTGVILFTPRGGGVIHRVSESGGQAEAVTALDTSKGENAHYWPIALPGGRSFLFFVRSTQSENNGIYLGSIDKSAPPVRLVTSHSSGLYAPPRGDEPGQVLWVRDGELLAQTLDAAAGRLTGAVRTVATDVRVEESQRGVFASVSDTGTLVWASAKAADFQLAWYGRDGRRIETLPIEPGKVMQPRLSPDGRKLAFTRASHGTADIWVLDLASGALTQVTTDPGYDENPSWSRDSRTLLHQGRHAESSGLLISTLDGSSPPRFLVASTDSDDGEFLPGHRAVIISRPGPKGGADLAALDIDRGDKLQELTSDPENEGQPAPSPDGRWIAFVSDKTGRQEVVLARLDADGTRFRLSDHRIPVSSAGGVDPKWSEDGREILYFGPDRAIMAATVTIAGNGVVIGKPVALFRVIADAGGYGSNWASNGDNTKFVVVEAVHGVSQTFRVLTNWQK